MLYLSMNVLYLMIWKKDEATKNTIEQGVPTAHEGRMFSPLPFNLFLKHCGFLHP